MAADEVTPAFEALLGYIRAVRGFDFTGYKRPSLVRRVRHRMETVGITDYTDYTDYLEVHPDEFAVLFDTILINVTSFYRDPPAWEFLRDHVVPDILARKDPSDPVRVWSAGCASGEEAYTLAMVFAEHIGQADVQDRVKVYATDVDDDALSRARQASYAARELATLPDDLQKKYFEANGGR